MGVIHHKGSKYVFSTEESIPVEFWREGKCATGRVFPDGTLVNENLLRIESSMKTVFHHFTMQHVVPTKEQFREKFLESLNRSKKTDFFLDFVHRHILSIRASRSELTLKKYYTMANKIEAYEKTRGRLRFADIDIAFYRAFKAWFYQSAYTKNYFGSIIKEIKMFMTAGLREGVHQCRGFEHPDFTTDKEEPDTVYLTTDELDNIYNMEFTPDAVANFFQIERDQNLVRKIEALHVSRDRFLVGCYSLLRVSDYKRLSEINMQDGYIRIKPKKQFSGRKNRDVIVPIHPRIREMMKNGLDLSRGVSEQKINKHIKEVCQMCGINEPILHTSTIQDKKIEKVFQKYELISTHTARRTAATNMLLSGIPASDIMLLGGWTSEKSFWRYIRMQPEIHAKKMAQHDFFKE